MHFTINNLSDSNADYALLLKTWFPEAGQYEVRLADTGEEAVILHDWLRMKMVRSGVPQLVNSGRSFTVANKLFVVQEFFFIRNNLSAISLDIS